MHAMADLGVDEMVMNASNDPRRGREAQGNFLLEIHERLVFFYGFSDGFGRGWEAPISLEKNHWAQKSTQDSINGHAAAEGSSRVATCTEKSMMRLLQTSD